MGQSKPGCIVYQYRIDLGVGMAPPVSDTGCFILLEMVPDGPCLFSCIRYIVDRLYFQMYSVPAGS